MLKVELTPSFKLVGIVMLLLWVAALLDPVMTEQLKSADLFDPARSSDSGMIMYFASAWSVFAIAYSVIWKFKWVTLTCTKQAIQYRFFGSYTEIKAAQIVAVKHKKYRLAWSLEIVSLHGADLSFSDIKISEQQWQQLKKLYGDSVKFEKDHRTQSLI